MTTNNNDDTSVLSLHLFPGETQFGLQLRRLGGKIRIRASGGSGGAAVRAGVPQDGILRRVVSINNDTPTDSVTTFTVQDVLDLLAEGEGEIRSLQLSVVVNPAKSIQEECEELGVALCKAVTTACSESLESCLENCGDFLPEVLCRVKATEGLLHNLIAQRNVDAWQSIFRAMKSDKNVFSLRIALGNVMTIEYRDSTLLHVACEHASSTTSSSSSFCFVDDVLALAAIGHVTKPLLFSFRLGHSALHLASSVGSVRSVEAILHAATLSGCHTELISQKSRPQSGEVETENHQPCPSLHNERAHRRNALHIARAYDRHAVEERLVTLALGNSGNRLNGLLVLTGLEYNLEVQVLLMYGCVAVMLTFFVGWTGVAMLLVVAACTAPKTLARVVTRFYKYYKNSTAKREEIKKE
eukprot:PhM_4_TR1566/c0_g1_i1/m.41790